MYIHLNLFFIFFCFFSLLGACKHLNAAIDAVAAAAVGSAPVTVAAAAAAAVPVAVAAA